ncbi:MAG: hypothetical protein RL112_1103 [Planctomycetota bacterium]|jgi:hypothetical protein
MLVPLLLQATQSTTPPLFEDASARALPGVEFAYGGAGKDWIAEVNGGGVLLGDFDGDGVLDCVLVDGSTVEAAEAGEPGRPARLFLGKGDGTFAPGGERWALPSLRLGSGGATGDVDGDGRLDLVLTDQGQVRVLLNAAQGWRESARLGEPGDWSTSAALFDADADGALDLYVVRYLEFSTKSVKSRASGACRWKGHAVMCGPEGLAPQSDRYFKGRGDGTFVDATRDSGIGAQAPSYGLGVMALDHDADGDTDLFVANDSMPNFLWENDGKGAFREVAFARGVSHDANGREMAAMGIAAGDVNGDLRDDLYVTVFSGEATPLYCSTKSGGYRDRGMAAGISGPSIPLLGWGASMHDFDLDGDLDLAVFNGHVYPQADLPGTDTSYAQRAQLLLNDGKSRFAESPLLPGARVSRACAAGDLDGDGDLDLVATRLDGPVDVLLNRAPRGAERHHLRVRAKLAGGKVDALGARVLVGSCGTRRAAEIRTSGGFQAAVPAEAHFGLGACAEIESVEVRFLSGRSVVVAKPQVDQLLVVVEPEAEKDGAGK